MLIGREVGLGARPLVYFVAATVVSEDAIGLYRVIVIGIIPRAALAIFLRAEPMKLAVVVDIVGRVTQRGEHVLSEHFLLIEGVCLVQFLVKGWRLFAVGFSRAHGPRGGVIFIGARSRGVLVGALGHDLFRS